MSRIIRKLLHWIKRIYISMRFRAQGIEAINAILAHTTIGVAELLSRFGAKVGDECVIHGPLIIHNAAGDYSNLVVHNKVHIGRQVFLDLTGKIEIFEEAVISMNSTLLTHQDVGDRILQSRFPRKVSPLTIGRGAYLGACSTILAGCDIGRETMVGAGAVVVTQLPDNVLAVGVPARVIKHYSS
jgi:acetyltransferase-like isoleucine patch superfamily enzyme